MVNQIVAWDIFINLGVESWFLIKTPSQINKLKKNENKYKYNKHKGRNTKDVAWFHCDSWVKQLK